MATDSDDVEPDFTGDDAEARCILCAQCHRYQPLDRDGQPTCDHSLAEAQDISDLSGEEWAMVRHDAYIAELERDEPRGARSFLVSELTSLMWDLTAAELLPDDYDERDGLDKLLMEDQREDA